MATISRLPDGRKQIDYKPPGYGRQSIRLGVAGDAAANEFKKRIDILIVCKKLGELPDQATLEWAKRIDRKYYQQLTRVGLLRLREAYTIGELCKWFIDCKSRQVEPSTLSKIVDDTNSFLKFADAKLNIEEFRNADADKFQLWALHNGGRYGKGLAEATVSRQCRRMSQMFQTAVDKQWLQDNPFESVRHYCERNEELDRYVALPMLQGIMDHGTDPQLNLMLALSRFAGLRGISEFQALRWEWVDWPTSTIKVFAKKTQRYASVRWRLIPICPALRDHLQGCWSIGETMVFSEKLVHQQIASRLEVLCRRASVALWPKPFTNLRASCECDWFREGHGIDAVTTWMGHSPETALRHYNRFVKQQSARTAAGLLQPGLGPNDVQQNPQHHMSAPRGPAHSGAGLRGDKTS